MGWRAWAQVEKRHRLGEAPYEIVNKDGNLLTYTGTSALWECLIGNGGSVGYYDNAHALIGVGNSGANPNDKTITALQGSNQKTIGMDSGFPLHFEYSVLTPITYFLTEFITWQATFGDSDANFSWNEIGVLNGSARLLNRYCFPFGTKAAGFWTVAVRLQLS